MKQSIAAAILLFAAMSVAFAAEGKNVAWTGWVNDAKCGSKVNASCARKCIGAGEARVFVNDVDKSVLSVANQDALKGHEGQHVKIEGSVDGSTLTVSSVSVIDDQGTK